VCDFTNLLKYHQSQTYQLSLSKTFLGKIVNQKIPQITNFETKKTSFPTSLPYIFTNSPPPLPFPLMPGQEYLQKRNKIKKHNCYLARYRKRKAPQESTAQ